MSSDNRSRGYDRNLYRDTDKGWLLGVCAGVAQAYDKPIWLARIAMLTLFLFSGSLAVLIYCAGYFLLAVRPQNVASVTHSPPLFDYGERASTRARRVVERLEQMDVRLQAIERYVTSSRYQVNEAFRKL
ncbi:MAG: envelope stress response membrane protein PspC [Gammaproteobacteria bacterium]|uniref:envelope stress response membrane protein PspC n=1 Tax=Pseudomaricurvus alcaniphilus TaxID=1166482 RepID=UPI0014088370|nr:envelope stress response membrane protein PspC [Pseudomaricurvus alcaniphilus]MBR9910698.1 envelope stress response membrane protein PspC [Gammaproteobacteria bacterium]NHN39038.1 envelope stress response membrane protein PspC [Pseudomaricurvus alcaniphilus]